MSKKREKEKEFKRQIISGCYAKPYWFRMTLGVVAGLLVGGSLFTSLRIIPKLLSVLDQPVNSEGR